VDQHLDKIIKTDCLQITEVAYLTGTGWVEQFLQTMSYSLLRVMLFLFTFYFKQKE
jgi:cardiolipin synthase